MTAGVCSITAGSAAIFRDRPAFAGHRNLFLIQRFSNGRISDLRNMTCTNFRCPVYARSGRRRTPGRTSGGARMNVARVSGGRRQIYYLPTETRKAPAPISTGLRTTPVSLLTGAGRILITSFRRAPPEPRPKCDRVHFKQKLRSTPWRIWNSATFGRCTISAGDRWICDVGIRGSGITLYETKTNHNKLWYSCYIILECWVQIHPYCYRLGLHNFCATESLLYVLVPCEFNKMSVFVKLLHRHRDSALWYRWCIPPFQG